ncbi:hypothetical protein [Streptomyces sp. NPDC058872]|uniref:hypothetical protein n=1 Tax=Streptomyces sp. NPDC058872 TaxID=3346661 RepID=UPI0036834BFA
MTLAVPRTWVVGEVVTAAYMNAEIRDQFNDLISGWTSYTPSWTSTGTAPAIGNGSLFGRYKLIGKLCIVNFEMLAGTTTTFGTGVWGFSAPFTAANPGSSTTNFSYLGSARGHSATAWYTGTVGILKNTSVARIYSHTGTSEWSSSQPHSWAALSSNYLQGQVAFETA